MHHPCLPQTLTPEALGEWIVKNATERIPHEEQVPLTEEMVTELEHKSSMASRKIDELKEVEKLFKEVLKKGTPVKNDDDGEPEHQSCPITIPPTKGLDALTANRQWADQQLRDGYTKEINTIYRIPFPEEDMLIGIDIEGQEWDQYTRDMTETEKQVHGLPINKAIAEAESDLFD